MEGKTTKKLIQLLQEKHGIETKEGRHRLKLLEMGYFHGFKGYRFLKTSDNRIPYSNFDEVVAVYEFDTKLKSLFYPYTMRIETALKNIVLDTVIGFGSADFRHIFDNLLNDFEKHPPGSRDYKKKMKNRLELRNKIYNAISYHYRTDKAIIQHFVHQDKPVPLWAIFEIINLGEIAFFIHCLNEETRMDIAKNLAMHNPSHDQKSRVLEDLISLVRDFRNAIAHNGVVFDCRFNRNGSPKRLAKMMHAEMDIGEIAFDTIVDYLVIHVYALKKIGVPRKELRRLVRVFQVLAERLSQNIPASIHQSIMGERAKDKMLRISTFIDK